MAVTDAPILESPDVIVELDCDSPILVVAFGSMMGRMGGIPHFEFMRILRKLGVKRAFVRDTMAVWYHEGVSGLEPTTTGLAAGLARLVELSSAERVVFIGASSGGYAAILFSCLVSAHDALAFGPQTFIDPDQRAAAGDIRWPRSTRRVSRCLNRRHADLRKVLSARGPAGERPRIQLHYALGNELDAVHARHLVDVPAVKLIPHAGEEHSLPSHLKDLGRLESTIARSLFPTKAQTDR